MDLSNLLEEALAERGNAVMLIACPRDGEDAVIRTGNAPFARILGWQQDRVAGLPLRELRPLVERPEDWATLMAALRSRSALKLDMRLRVKGREVWLGFNLTFNVDASDNGGYGILIGRDITEARERHLRETESQHLLASVFLRIGAAVAIIDSDSAILMANPACLRLLEYGPGEMAGKHVEGMIAPGSVEAVLAARARQLGGAGDYVLPITLLAKGGKPVPATLHSTLLRDARDRQLRVATLIPDVASHIPQPGAMPEATGQVREVSLAALKAAYGDAWRLIADHAMALAEQILKRSLGAADVLRRRNDHGFLIWFDGANEVRNTGVLTAATREIRQRLLDDADFHVPDRVSSVSVGAEAIPDAPLQRAATSRDEMDLDFQDDERPPLERDPGALMQYLRSGAVATVESVTGRDGVARPIVLVDFEPSVRRCLYRMAPEMPREPERGTGFDLMRLDLAVQVLAQQHGEVKVLTPISWPALADPDCRQFLDRRLAQIGARSRSRIVLAVSGVPGLVTKQHWVNAVGSLRRQLSDVGLLLTHRTGELAAVQEAITSGWPLSLLVVDRTEGPPVLIDEYRGLFAAARRREIPVLVRTTARNDVFDWRQLGATMFAAAA